MIRVALEVVDPRNGKTTVVECAHSWVKQMAQLWLALALHGSVSGVVDTGGAGRSVFWGTDFFMYVAAGAGDDSFGLLVGTSAVAPTRDDINLGAKVTHGNGVGQLFHQAVILGTPLAVAGGSRVSISRQFDNNSGGPIMVEEIGLAVRYVGGPWHFLVLHDSVTEVVPDGAARVFKYHLDWLA